MLNKLEKQQVISRIREEAGRSLDGALADYRGTDVVAISKLRGQARRQGVYLKVARNSLIRRGLERTEFACLDRWLQGPSMLGFSQRDMGSVARLFKDFAKEHPGFQVKGLVVRGRLLAPEEISVLADLPTRDEALGQLAGVLLAPVRKTAVLMKELPTSLARALDALRGQKE